MIIHVCIDQAPPSSFEVNGWEPKEGDIFYIDSGANTGLLEVLDVESNPSGTQVQATRI